jgi:cytochrome c oxidase assembly protein subunit 11
MNNTSQSKQLIALVAVAVGMFGFAFALVPLYDVFCELTGLNGKTGASEFVIKTPAASSDRVVTVQFIARVGNGLPWEFRPTENQLQVRIGAIHTTYFYVRNRANHVVSGQAVPSVSPGQAAVHLRKIECFCFVTQTLEAGAEMEMPVRFLVDSDLADDINTLSLSYTLFPVGNNEPRTAEHNKPDAAREELRL